MTLPYEEQRTLKMVRETLVNWFTRKDRPKNEQEWRSGICHLLRHYPMDYRIDELYKKDAEGQSKEDRRIKYNLDEKR